MSCVRFLICANLFVVFAVGVDAAYAWWSNPGTWGAARIAELLTDKLDAERVALEPDPSGGYRGQAYRDGHLAFRLEVSQAASDRRLEWKATRTDGRTQSGSQREGHEGTLASLGLLLLAGNLAFVALFTGARLTASFSTATRRDLFGLLLGVPVFLCGAISLGYDWTAAQDRSIGQWLLGGLWWMVTFFGMGLFSRSIRNTGGTRSKSQSEREHEPEDREEEQETK